MSCFPKVRRSLPSARRGADDYGPADAARHRPSLLVRTRDPQIRPEVLPDPQALPTLARRMTDAEASVACAWLKAFLTEYEPELIDMARGRFARGAFAFPGG